MAPTPRQPSEERHLALLVAQATDAIFLLSTDGVVLTWNAGAEAMTGYAAEEAIGRQGDLLYAPEDAARGLPETELREALEGRFEGEAWRVGRDGTRRWSHVVMSAVRDDAGEPLGVGVVQRDLTHQQRSTRPAMARARELEAGDRQHTEFRRLVSSVRDYAIFMLSPAGYIRSWNVGAEHLKGYRSDEVIGRHFSLFYTPEDRARDHPGHELELAQRDGRYEEEGWRLRRDGTRMWAGVTITAVHDEDGNLTGFAKVTRDLTERKRAEEELRGAVERLRTANEELDRFTTVAAHDMTDPLRTITGFAEILEHESLPAETVAAYAGHVRSSSVRLDQMLQGLLTFARAGTLTGPAEPVALSVAIDEVRADLAGLLAERRVRLDLDVPDDAVVLADPRDVRLVVQNLVTNAVKFADADRPTVTIRCAPRPAGRWSTSVQDNGPGVAPEDRQRIFGAFQRATGEDQPGVGLGLAICQRLVDRHGGTIELDPGPGAGSRFSFSLPAAPR